jgi:predicted amidophosphoribosyltransferase
MAPVNQPERLHVPLICKPARCRWKGNNSPAVKSHTSRLGNFPLASHTTPSQCPNDHDRRRQLCWSCRLNANHPREKHAVRGVLFFLARSLPFRNLFPGLFTRRNRLGAWMKKSTVRATNISNAKSRRLQTEPQTELLEVTLSFCRHAGRNSLPSDILSDNVSAERQRIREKIYGQPATVDLVESPEPGVGIPWRFIGT